VPSSYRVTSPFGPRICPFHGRELHPGIDIGAPSGSPIVAAGAGRVTYAGGRGSYGNVVMIDHGNGVVTLYAHQRTGGIKVGVGQSVDKGQRIGTVGSTGNSTGPHLHWEVRVNGAAKNPMSYR
jgi:murein DD-endopeptidase MepM/ murein hydrolase activator NlpD